MYTILSIDGGGCKGMIAAEFIRNICINNPGFLDQIDCIVGVSSGSLVGAMLASGISAHQIVEIFRDQMGIIFKKLRRRTFCSCWGLRGPKYSNAVLWNSIYNVVGDIKLKQLKKDFMCYSYDIKKSRPNIFINNTKGKIPEKVVLSDSRDYHVISDDEQSVIEAVYQSCLAPTFFHDENGIIDGSVMTNNPTMIAVAMATSYYGIPIDQIRVLSIGTKERIQVPIRYTATIFFWIRNIIYFLMEASSDHTKLLCDMLLGVNYLRVEVPCGLPINSFEHCDTFIELGYNAYIRYRDRIDELLK